MEPGCDNTPSIYCWQNIQALPLLFNIFRLSNSFVRNILTTAHAHTRLIVFSQKKYRNVSPIKQIITQVKESPTKLVVEDANVLRYVHSGSQRCLNKLS